MKKKKKEKSNDKQLEKQSFRVNGRKIETWERKTRRIQHLPPPAVAGAVIISPQHGDKAKAAKALIEKCPS